MDSLTGADHAVSPFTLNLERFTGSGSGSLRDIQSGSAMPDMSQCMAPFKSSPLKVLLAGASPAKGRLLSFSSLRSQNAPEVRITIGGCILVQCNTVRWQPTPRAAAAWSAWHL
jgi:hypothetical protein